jgi:hypothetical protein
VPLLSKINELELVVGRINSELSWPSVLGAAISEDGVTAFGRMLETLAVLKKLMGKKGIFSGVLTRVGSTLRASTKA